MNRIFMRALGGCMAVYGVFFGRDASAADVAMGANFAEVKSPIVLNGFMSTYEALVCDTPQVIHGNCSGLCDATGTYCMNSEYFTERGCVSGAGQSSSCLYSAGANADAIGYTFKGCKAGFYMPKSASGSAICRYDTSGQIVFDKNELLACCMPCPSFEYEGYGQDGKQGITDAWDGNGSNCANDWCWDVSVSGGVVYGMAACQAKFTGAISEYQNASGDTYHYTNTICSFVEAE